MKLYGGVIVLYVLLTCSHAGLVDVTPALFENAQPFLHSAIEPDQFFKLINSLRVVYRELKAEPDETFNQAVTSPVEGQYDITSFVSLISNSQATRIGGYSPFDKDTILRMYCHTILAHTLLRLYNIDTTPGKDKFLKYARDHFHETYPDPIWIQREDDVPDDNRDGFDEMIIPSTDLGTISKQLGMSIASLISLLAQTRTYKDEYLTSAGGIIHIKSTYNIFALVQLLVLAADQDDIVDRNDYVYIMDYAGVMSTMYDFAKLEVDDQPDVIRQQVNCVKDFARATWNAIYIQNDLSLMPAISRIYDLESEIYC